ncbi:MAG: DNA polymerase III subunit gamma/tau [Neisseriaceae bacterium]
MNYQVLARRLRPRKFSEVVGQDHVTQALLNSIKRNSLHHAYLLTGTRGVGKTTIARIFAKSLNCPQAVEGEPCGDCEVCQSIDEGKFTDLLELDAASNTGIDSIRELLDNAVYLPVEGKYKVYLIDEVHMLSKSAFNAMLKALEEPPDHVKFILATTDPQKVPITVLSRCLQLILRNLSAGEIQSHLEEVLRKEGVSHEPVAVSIISRAAAGSMRDALSLLDQAIALGNGVVCAELVNQMLGLVEREHLYDLLEAIHREEKELIYSKLQWLDRQTISFQPILNELAILLKELATAKAFSIDLYPGEEKFKILAESLSEEEIQVYYQAVIRGKEDQSIAPDEYTGFLMTIMRLMSFRPYFLASTLSQSSLTAQSTGELKKKVNLTTATEVTGSQDRQIERVKEVCASPKPLSRSLSHAYSNENKRDCVPQIVTDNLKASSAEQQRWLEYMQLANECMPQYAFLLRNIAWISMEAGVLKCSIKDETAIPVDVLQPAKLTIEKFFLERWSVQVLWLQWQAGLLTYNQFHNLIAEEKRRKGLEHLNSDKIATRLKEVFEGEWDIQNIYWKER